MLRWEGGQMAPVELQGLAELLAQHAKAAVAAGTAVGGLNSPPPPSTASAGTLEAVDHLDNSSALGASAAGSAAQQSNGLAAGPNNSTTCSDCVQLIPSQKRRHGGFGYVAMMNGYVYHCDYQREGSAGARVYWKCTQRGGCGARLITDKKGNVLNARNNFHSHPPAEEQQSTAGPGAATTGGAAGATGGAENGKATPSISTTATATATATVSTVDDKEDVSVFILVIL